MIGVFDVFRREFQDRVLSSNPDSILDVGSGQGQFLRGLKGKVARLSGVDVDPEQCAHLEMQGFEAVIAEAGCLPFSDGEFDTVVFSFACHHLPNWSAALNEALRVARNRVQVLDGWYDLDFADQDTTRALDVWCNAFDRTDVGLISPKVLLTPILHYPNITVDYACRRIHTVIPVEEIVAIGQECRRTNLLEPHLSAQFDEIVEKVERHGASEVGCIQLTVSRN
jgi:SAM-dependent methyltransferase